MKIERKGGYITAFFNAYKLRLDDTPTNWTKALRWGWELAHEKN